MRLPSAVLVESRDRHGARGQCAGVLRGDACVHDAAAERARLRRMLRRRSLTIGDATTLPGSHVVH
jgi:hypothetical protein